MEVTVFCLTLCLNQCWIFQQWRLVTFSSGRTQWIIPWMDLEKRQFNPFWPSGPIWWYRYVETLAQIFFAWGHQGITWASVDFKSVMFGIIHLEIIPQWLTRLLFCIISLKSLFKKKLLAHFPWIIDLKWQSLLGHQVIWHFQICSDDALLGPEAQRPTVIQGCGRFH